MIKQLIISVIFLSFGLTSFAIEEINLDLSEEKNQNTFDYLSDVYYGKIEDVSPVLKVLSKDGLKIENSFFNSVKTGFTFSEDMTFENDEHYGDKSFVHRFAVLEPSLKVRFNDNKDEFNLSYNFARKLDNYDNRFTEKFTLLGMSHKFSPEQSLYIGQGSRVPIGYDGSIGHNDIPFVIRSQIGRNLGNVRSVGVRNIAKYKYINWDIGVYDSTRYMKHFGKGCEFAGYAMLKPFGEDGGKFGNFKFGTGYNIGKNNINYNQYSLFAAYDYKKFHIQGEYASANGSNGISENGGKPYGFYSHIAYNINPKFQLLARADYYTPDKNVSHINTTELTAGITYNPFKNMKFMLNYVRRLNSNSSDSDMILFATRFII